MSRRANITSLAAALLLLGCASTSRPLVTVRECIGDVVPLCATLRIADDGSATYKRRTAHLRATELETLRRALQAADVLSYEGNDRASGPLVTIELPGGARTFPAADLPPPIAPLMKEIHRIGKRAFGRAYGEI